MYAYHRDTPAASLDLTRTAGDGRDLLLIRDGDEANTGSTSLIRAIVSKSGVLSEVFRVDKTGTVTTNGLPMLRWVSAPLHFNSLGTAGDVAFDGTGAFYYCYATNLWGKLTGTLIGW